MRFSTRLKPTQSLIDMTPLVDVIFLLLIFFIVTSDVLPLKSLYLEQPSLTGDSLPLTTRLMVVVDSEEVIYVGSKKSIVDLESLQDYLRKEIGRYKESHGNAVPAISLNIDRRISYETFMRILDKVHHSGAPIRLAYKNEGD